MSGKRARYVVFVLFSALLLSAGKAHSESSFPTLFVPVLPEILRPEPLPPTSPGPVIPGETAIVTEGISDVGSTREAGNTIQVTTATESAGSGMSVLSSPVLLPPYALPPTDTELSLASPYGGPGYASAGRPRTGTSGRRYAPTRARTRGMLSPVPVPTLTGGPLDPARAAVGPLSPPEISRSDGVPAEGAAPLSVGTTRSPVE